MDLTLESNRILLMCFKKEDAYRIAELANNEELANILGLPHPYKIDIAQEWIATQPELIKMGIEYPLTIIDKQVKEIVGTITIRVDKKNNKGELGYWIGRDFWGKGYASEAVNRMIEFGFIELHLNKIWASAISRNIASIKVLEKSGFQKEGTLRQNKLLLDTYEDVDVFGLLRCDYIK